MKKVTFPFNEQRSLNLTGGGTQSWSMARIPQKLKNGRPAFLRAIWFEFAGTLNTAASTGVAFKWSEFWKLITQLRISRQAGIPRVKITGHSVRCWNALTNYGIDRGMVLQDDVGSNSGGSAVTTPFTVRLGFRFDTPGWCNKNYFVKPVAQYENGSIDLQYGNPATVWHSTLTLITGLTVNVFAELGSERNCRDGVDIELFNIDSTVTATGTSVQIPRGDYPLIAMACEKFATAAGGGGDDHTLFSAIHSTNFFPEELPSLSGAQLRDRYLLDQTEGQAESAVKLGNCVPLVYPEQNSDIFSCRLRAEQDWQLTTTLSSSLANGHRLLLARVLPRDAEDIRRTTCAHGIDPAQTTVQVEVPDVSQPSSARESHFWPVRLVPGSAPTNMVRSTARVPSAKTGCC